MLKENENKQTLISLIELTAEPRFCLYIVIIWFRSVCLD